MAATSWWLMIGSPYPPRSLEEAVLSGGLAADQLFFQERVGRLVVRRDGPFDAVEDVLVSLAAGGCHDGVDEGSGTGFGYGVALGHLAADRRQEPVLLLMFGGDSGPPLGRGRND